MGRPAGCLICGTVGVSPRLTGEAVSDWTHWAWPPVTEPPRSSAVTWLSWLPRWPIHRGLGRSPSTLRRTRRLAPLRPGSWPARWPPGWPTSGLSPTPGWGSMTPWVPSPSPTRPTLTSSPRSPNYGLPVASGTGWPRRVAPHRTSGPKSSTLSLRRPSWPGPTRGATCCATRWPPFQPGLAEPGQ